MLPPDVDLLPVAIRMSERTTIRMSEMLFGRAELSELLFRDKAKSTLLSINGALMSNGNKGITNKFKRLVTYQEREYLKILYKEAHLHL